MDAELQCIICLGTLNNPVTFPCFSHSVCKEPCLAKMIAKKEAVTSNNNENTLSSSVVVDCPVCGPDSRLQVDDFELLPQNRTLSRIINLHSSGQLCKTDLSTPSPTPTPSEDMDTSTPKGLKCEACDNAASIECIACGCLLCDTHDQSIHLVGKLKKHPRYPVVNDSSSAAAHICSIHGKVRELFCLTDNELICCHCLIADGSSHLSHECKSIDYAAVVLRARLDASRAKLEGSLAERIASVDDLKTAHDAILKAKFSVEEEIDKKVDSLIKALEKKRVALKEGVGLLARTKTGIISLEIDEYQRQVTKIEGLIKSINTQIEDPYNFVPHAVAIEQDVKAADHLPVIPPVPLSPGLERELYTESLAQCIDNLDLSSPMGAEVEGPSKEPLRRAANILSLSLPLSSESNSNTNNTSNNNNNLYNNNVNNNINNNNYVVPHTAVSSPVWGHSYFHPPLVVDGPHFAPHSPTLPQNSFNYVPSTTITYQMGGGYGYY